MSAKGSPIGGELRRGSPCPSVMSITRATRSSCDPSPRLSLNRAELGGVGIAEPADGLGAEVACS